MKCCRCPLYHYWSNESDRGEACAIFGDGWDSPFQYEDKEGTIIGCYLDRHFIEKADAERDEYYASMAESMSQYFKTEQNTSESDIDDDCPFVDMTDIEDEPQTDCKVCLYRNISKDSPHCMSCKNNSKFERDWFAEPQTDCAWRKGE